MDSRRVVTSVHVRAADSRCAHDPVLGGVLTSETCVSCTAVVRRVGHGQFALVAHVVGQQSSHLQLWHAYVIGFWMPMCISGALLFGHFAMSHTHTDTVPADQHKEWHAYALEHSVDISHSHLWCRT